jgi:hypothetical protein
MQGKKISMNQEQKEQFVKVLESMKPLIDSGLSFSYLGREIQGLSLFHVKYGFSFDSILKELKRNWEIKDTKP